MIVMGYRIVTGYGIQNNDKVRNSDGIPDNNRVRDSDGILDSENAIHLTCILREHYFQPDSKNSLIDN